MAFRAFFSNIVHAHLRFGHVYVALVENQVAGVAVWRPPEAGGDTLRDRVRTLSTHLLVRSLFPRTAGDLFRGFATTIALHPQAPHWYLFFMGVDVDLQGQGIGSRLLAPVLELADRTGTLCYLETPFPRTHAFYRRLGFEISSESHPFRGAPTLWTMTRHRNPRKTVPGTF
jgi:GNAT superfamily N-acetyltransferase